MSGSAITDDKSYTYQMLSLDWVFPLVVLCIVYLMYCHLMVVRPLREKLVEGGVRVQLLVAVVLFLRDYLRAQHCGERHAKAEGEGVQVHLLAVEFGCVGSFRNVVN